MTDSAVLIWPPTWPEESDFEITFQPQEISGIVIRETKPGVVKERMLRIKQRKEEIHLHNEHRDINLDNYAQDATPAPEAVSKIGTWKDIVSVWFCRNFHSKPTYKMGDQYSQCPSCFRRYAVPWADFTQLDHGVYVTQDKYVHTGPTQQALCRNGFRGMA